MKIITLVKVIGGFLLLTFSATGLHADNGMLNVASNHNVAETSIRLERILITKGMIIIKKINHSKIAEKTGTALRDTQLIIFGNPKIGSKLMKCQQSVAIDLPLKALIWEDEQGKTWISYNNIKYLRNRHNISGCDATLEKMTTALAKMTQLAAS